MALALHVLQTWFDARRSAERGATVVEYAMLLAMLAIVCLVAVNLIGAPVSTGLSNGGNGFRP